MIDFLQALVAFPTAIFTLLLGVVVLYWALVHRYMRAPAGR